MRYLLEVHRIVKQTGVIEIDIETENEEEVKDRVLLSLCDDNCPMASWVTPAQIEERGIDSITRI
jgi:hypothetical protein